VTRARQATLQTDEAVLVFIACITDERPSSGVRFKLEEELQRRDATITSKEKVLLISFLKLSTGNGERLGTGYIA
jgi:hypothetical protein